MSKQGKRLEFKHKNRNRKKKLKPAPEMPVEMIVFILVACVMIFLGSLWFFLLFA